MKTQRIGTSDLISTRLNYGNMRVVGGWDPAKVTPQQFEHGIECIYAAVDAGINHLDTADIYCRGKCEEVLGAALKQRKGMRERIILTTKVGIRFPDDPYPGAPQRYDFSAEHVVGGCERSLKRLGVETIDLYLLHRPDMLMNPAEIAGAFEKLKSSGKVRWFGVSNFKPSLTSMLQKFLPMPIVANQLHINPSRLDELYNGTLDQCIEMNITPQAWSPMAGGLMGDGGKPRDDSPRKEGLLRLVEVIDAVAKEVNATREVTTLAWLLKHPAGIMPVLGTSRPERIGEQCKADAIELTREQWYRIFVAGRMKKLP